MSEPSRPVSVSAWDWITAAEHAHTEGVRAIVAGIRGRDDLRQWASVRAATIRAKGAVNADELRLILDVIDTSAALVLSPDKAAALSCDVRWAMQQAGLAPASENVKALRVALAALQVAETRLPFTGTHPAEGEKPPADNAESPTTPQTSEEATPPAKGPSSHLTDAEKRAFTLYNQARQEFAEKGDPEPTIRVAFDWLVLEGSLNSDEYEAFKKALGRARAKLREATRESPRSAVPIQHFGNNTRFND